jgi:hypothetical protein
MKPTGILLVALAFYGLGLETSLAHTSIEAGPITRVTVVQGAACEPTCDRATTSSRDFVDVPEASAEITVDKTSVLVARFASDSFCSAQFTLVGMVQPSYCSLRLLASVGPGGDFVEMEPVMLIFEEFQVDQGTGAHAIERSFGPISPGTYMVKAQFSIPFGIDPGATFSLTGWHLTVEGATMLRGHR